VHSRFWARRVPEFDTDRAQTARCEECGGTRRVGAPADRAAEDPLTRREHEVVELVARGLSNVEIADRLFISKRTVESHLEHVKEKLGHGSRHQVMAWALRAELQEPPSDYATRSGG
jgi:DNA-binding CsgD family transcriptional regulator